MEIIKRKKKAKEPEDVKVPPRRSKKVIDEEASKVLAKETVKAEGEGTETVQELTNRLYGPGNEIGPLTLAPWERASNYRVPATKKVFGKITYAEVEEAVRNSHGLITTVARQLKLSVYFVKQIFAKYKTLKQEFDEFRELMLDEMEGELMKKIRKGDTTATIFALKCLGKNRGYIEQAQGSQKKGGVNIKFKKATDDDVKKVKKADAKGVKASESKNVIDFKKAVSDGSQES